MSDPRKVAAPKNSKRKATKVKVNVGDMQSANPIPFKKGGACKTSSRGR
jgi:hypothetical protein